MKSLGDLRANGAAGPARERERSAGVAADAYERRWKLVVDTAATLKSELGITEGQALRAMQIVLRSLRPELVASANPDRPAET